MRSFFKLKKYAMWSYPGGICILTLIWLQVNISVEFVSWHGRFYDLLQQSGKYLDKPENGLKALYDCIFSLDYLTKGNGEKSFLILAFCSILLTVLVQWVSRLYALKWREAMTLYYVSRWSKAIGNIEGESQRIQEDCSRFAIIMESIGIKIFKTFLTLIAFIPMLYNLSSGIKIMYFYNMDGGLVWICLLIAILGWIVSWIVGVKLPNLEYNNQKSEAAFRKELVLAEDDRENYASPNTICNLFNAIKMNYKKLYCHYGYFDLWASFYNQIMVILPLIITIPELFNGNITLGVLMQVSLAFNKVHGGFAFFLNNWTTITELRSIHKRLSEFEAYLDQNNIQNAQFA